MFCANSNFYNSMKKRSNLLRSNKSRTHSSSLNDLITQSEQTVSSQASVYTNHSKNSQRSSQQYVQSSTRSQDFDDYQDIIAEDIDTLFITPEEQKKIQNILQFARKGKINPGNAFEIPVRVIDPQLTESNNMRFWKFSSELLSASMSIYDKRVENMYQNTNRMFDNLIRVQGKSNEPITEEDIEEKQKKQRGQLIQMQVGEIGKIEAVSSYEIGAVNCELGDKINIKNMHNQFLPDPLFHKRLQAFDSNTLKSLFMNVFEFGTQHQILFFNEDHNDQMDIQTKQEEYEQRVPKFVTQQIQNIASIAQNNTIFSRLTNFTKENVRESIENVRYQVKDFTSQLNLIQQHQSNNNLQFSINDPSQTNINSIQGDNEFHFQFNVSEHTQLSQDTHIESQSMPISVISQSQTQFYYQNTSQGFTEMTPWELEFKGMKLQRKKMKRGENRNRRRATPLSERQQIEINFLDDKTQSRSKIFSLIKHKIDYKQGQYDETNLLPKNMNPFTQAYKKRKMPNIRQTNFIHNRQANGFLHKQTQQIHQQSEPFPQNQPLYNENPKDQQQNTEKGTNFESNLYHHEHQSQGFVYRSVGIGNLRQIKQKIYKHIAEGRSVRLSDLNLNINPNSILVIFLHLVNQNNIEITSIDGQYDIQISPKRR